MLSVIVNVVGCELIHGQLMQVFISPNEVARPCHEKDTNAEITSQTGLHLVVAGVCLHTWPGWTMAFQLGMP